MVVFNLPEFDTGQYEDCELRMAGSDAFLRIRIAEIRDICLTFQKVRWHQFTALPNCTSLMIKDSYFALTEVTHSPDLSAFLAHDRSSAKAYRELHHYRIFLDETGCHEFFAESAHAGS